MLGGSTNATFDVSAGAGQYQGFGNYVKTGTSTWTLLNSTATTTPWTISQGTLAISTSGSLGNTTGTLTFDGGTLQAGAINLTVANNAHVNATGGTIDNNAAVFTYAGVISGPGGMTITNSGGSGGTIFTNTNTYTGGTTINHNAVLEIGFGGTTGSIVGNVLDNGSLAFGRADTLTFAGMISGAGGVGQFGSGTLVLTGANSYTGGTSIVFGTLTVGNNNALGTGTLAMAAGTTLSFLNTGNFNIANPIAITGDPTFTPPSGTRQTLSGVISDGSSPGTVEISGAGTLVLAATNTYTGATNVNSGVLDVTGSIATSSLTTVSNGAMLIGTGTLGNTQINSGGTFAPGAAGAPGTSMTVAGNLAFQSGAIYLVQINPSATTSATATGTAMLTGATVNAQFASSGYLSKKYTLLTANGGFGGTTFAALTNTNLPAGASDSLSYDANHVYLNLTANFGSDPALNGNQGNVGNALNNSFNTNGGIPAAFVGLSPAALSQLDGEAATGAERGAFALMNEFLGLMLDPFVYGRNGVAAPGDQAIGFAPDARTSLPPDVALAYDSILKAPPLTSDQRWTAWGAAYGGSNTTNGNAAVGSSNVTASTFGFAAGMDYHLTPNTIFGFALAGGGLNWGLAGGLGGGRSDALQAGVYSISYFGPAYVSGALAFANHWFTTNRSALGDQLTANFDGQSYGARFEGGYRYAVLPVLGVTPYGALHAQGFHTPGYSETDVTGGGFGLTYAAMNASDVRTELGGRFDAPTLVAGMPLILRGRVAWAHDFVGNPALSAAFETLPGGSFTVNGAPIAQNSALVSAGAQLFITPSWSLLAKFDGEFASSSQTYGGSGTLRYAW
jgi:autotransporter-associated beta strand protein